MKKMFLTLITLIIVGICIPAVSASTVILDEHIKEFTDSSGSGTPLGRYYHDDAPRKHINGFWLDDVSKYTDLSYVVVDTVYLYGRWAENNTLITPGRYEFSYTFNGEQKPCVMYVSRTTDLFGNPQRTKMTFFFNDWSVAGVSGGQSIQVPVNILNSEYCALKINGETLPIVFSSNGSGPLYVTSMRISPSTSQDLSHNLDNLKITWASARVWQNIIKVESEDRNRHLFYDVSLIRELGGLFYSSTLKLYKNDALVYTNAEKVNRTLTYPVTDIDKLELITEATTYKYPLITETPGEPGEPATASVTVYVKNSQTGALIADANIVIDALVNGEYYPVVNRTEPSGIFSVTLQPTGGGQPNPDGYRLIATADGYNNPMPEINFTVDDYKLSIHCLLDPIAGGPLNENKTFIDFFVRDMSSNPISGATVKFGKYTLITNSQGYTVFEVDKSNTYSWTISKSGYGPLTGNAVIGDAPRHTINTVLAPAVTPAPQTPIPTGTVIGPKPTMTAPTGEPASNWLEWFAAHFGMILGGGVEIGKIFMWLCFTVPVGVYVGKEAKAGAAGFMAGAGIVTLFFVLIGWVPIWLVVLMALIIGLLYAKVFNSQDNGGGR